MARHHDVENDTHLIGRRAALVASLQRDDTADRIASPGWQADAGQYGRDHDTRRHDTYSGDLAAAARDGGAK